MKKILNIALAMLAMFGVACNPNNGDSGGKENGPLTFSVDISNITANGATISITPSNNDTYYFDIVDKAYYDSFATPMEFLADFVADFQEVVNELIELGAISSVEDILSSGSRSLDVTDILEPGSNYYVVVFGISTDFTTTTTVTSKLFRTMSDNSEEVTFGINNGDKDINNFTRGYCSNYDDNYEVGAATWTISLYNEDGMSNLNIDLMADFSATELPWGEYSISSSFGVGTALAGNWSNAYSTYGTVWTVTDSDWTTLLEAVYCKSGTVTIVKEGDNYTINVDAIDEFGNTAKFSYNGALDLPIIGQSSPKSNNLSPIKKEATKRGLLLSNLRSH